MISIILPSWLRTNDLLRSIDNLRDTTEGYEIEIVTVLNERDKESRVLVERLSNPIIKPVIVPRDVPNGRPHRCWQLGYLASRGEWAVQTADDVVFEDGWLDVALHCDHKGFVAFNEARWGSMLAVHWMATREYISTVMGGYFGLTYYYTSWSDNEVKHRAVLAGRHTFCADARFVHLNRAALAEELDTYAQIAPEYASQDQKTFNARMKAGYPVRWTEV